MVFTLQNSKFHKYNRLYHLHGKLSSITMSDLFDVSLKVNFSRRINTRYPITGKAIWNRHLNHERDYRCLYALHISIAINVIAKSSSSCFEEVERGYFASGSNVSWHEVKRISITIAITDLYQGKKIGWKYSKWSFAKSRIEKKSIRRCTLCPCSFSKCTFPFFRVNYFHGRD